MATSYESDITRFLRDLKSQHPEIEADQRAGRSIFWDKDIDPDLYKRFRQSSVPQPAYVYQPRIDE